MQIFEPIEPCKCEYEQSMKMRSSKLKKTHGKIGPIQLICCIAIIFIIFIVLAAIYYYFVYRYPLESLLKPFFDFFTSNNKK